MIFAFISIISILVFTLTLMGCKEEKRTPINVDKIFINNKCSDYFYNLGTNYPKNVKGSCGYVGVSMLLAYYADNYDETIIDNKYKASPYGLLGAPLDEIKDLSNKEYIDYMYNNSEKYFQGLLLKSTLSIYPLYNPNKALPLMLYDGSSSRISGYYSEHHAILDNYLYNVMGFSEDYIKTTRIKEDIRNTLITKIKEGIPVLLSTNYNGKDGHTFICYDYDEKEDEIYGNLLMVENYNHIKISSYYNKMNAHIYIDINENKQD